ncbi:uncharacterized protein LOC125534951 [Triticum urartu]|uniref:uncharacterized protein LOC125534951 n=1 Tax=Triticum urartu TaxID=4572 RepID=UPI002044BA26|nr:uncharacterized protein LOC125534951 [Triticum urartu]
MVVLCLHGRARGRRRRRGQAGPLLSPTSPGSHFGADPALSTWISGGPRLPCLKIFPLQIGPWQKTLHIFSTTTPNEPLRERTFFGDSFRELLAFLLGDFFHPRLQVMP